MIRTMPVLAFDEVAARIHGRVRAQLRRAGRSAPFADSLVASIALANELTVVTANVRDFVEIPELRIEDWTAG